MGMAPRDFCKNSESNFVSRDCDGKHRRIKARAFTLVELLVTISILGLLAGLSIPAIQTARATAQVGGCMSNIRQLTTAMLTAAADNNGLVFAGNGNKTGWATLVGGGTTVTNGFLWTNGYVKDAKAFLCPHGRKTGPPWYGSAACHYSLNVAPLTNNPINPLDPTEFPLNRIQNPSKVIMLFEEAVVTQAQDKDCRALLDANLPADQGDARLFTQQSGMVNHRKKGCVSFYDGSALSLTATEWQTMLNTQTKRKLYYGVP
jgi:prepilin-type N-terminal cleavage/methylation domain-containing protein